MSKKVAAMVAILVIAFFVAAVYRRHEAKRSHLRMEQQAAEMVWQRFVTQYQHDLPLGTPRIEVEKYLDNQKAHYTDGREIMVKIGETPDDGPFCDFWYVYASFEFQRPQSQAEGSPMDRLAVISLKKVGHCL